MLNQIVKRFFLTIQSNKIWAGDEVSTRGDACGFGIMMLEMMRQKQPTRELFPDGLDLWHLHFQNILWML